ncbi:MAG: T9SS type A sorting domain-containing protein, partial [Ignavibacteria bacterium]|nr:T9SS type A sorting domain-containing protein [Ignavibacteria bacterium]
YGPGSAQLTWLENDLAASTKPWKFIYLHEPGWSAGGHGNEIPVQLYIQPLCEQYGVPIVFGGHNHYYARAVVNGVQHITTGGGGAPLYLPDPSYPNIVTATRANHFCTIAIDDGLLSFKAIKPDGTLIDSFTTAGYNFPPVITSLPDTNAYVDSLYQYQVIAEDNNGDTLTYNLNAAPSWLNIDTTSGLIQGIPTASSAGDTVVTVMVDDGHGRTDTQTYSLHILNPVGIDSETNQVPQQYALYQNFPNPFNPSTTIEFVLPTSGSATLNIFNVLGELVVTLVSENLTAGNYKYEWNATELTSGMYFYRLQASSFVEIKKMVLMK